MELEAPTFSLCVSKGPAAFGILWLPRARFSAADARTASPVFVERHPRLEGARASCHAL